MRSLYIYWVRKCILDFQRVHLWSMREFFRWGLIGPPVGPRSELQLFSTLSKLGVQLRSLYIYWVRKCILDFQRVHLWSMREFFRWGLIGPPVGPRSELQLFSTLIPLGGIIYSGPLWSPYLSLFLSYIWSKEKYFNL